jgi:UTP--glucose-1-phosphate uridylyltransferase
MKVSKAVITAAAPGQRTLPLQTLIDQDGVEKSVLRIILEEVLRANVEEVCIVVCPGDEATYEKVAGDHAGRIRFVHQPEPLGYGHAVYCAREFVGNDPFLHLVGDHLYVSSTGKGCARQLVDAAEAQDCAVSAVEITRESRLPHYGAVGGQRVAGSAKLYRVEAVIEKPTPTEAEQRLIVPGLRAGYYLCFFGMHVLTPTVMELLHRLIGEGSGTRVSLSAALAQLARKEQYLALEEAGRRYNVGVNYGLLMAQFALALNGDDREEVLSRLLEVMAWREQANAVE